MWSLSAIDLSFFLSHSWVPRIAFAMCSCSAIDLSLSWSLSSRFLSAVLIFCIVIYVRTGPHGLRIMLLVTFCFRAPRQCPQKTSLHAVIWKFKCFILSQTQSQISLGNWPQISEQRTPEMVADLEIWNGCKHYIYSVMNVCLQ